MRRIIEQTYKTVPQLVIDPEGEFDSLRTLGHSVAPIIGMASRMLGANAAVAGRARIIYDISEMNPLQREQWVQRYLDELMAIQRNEWRPVLIVIDEAHLFAPQEGAAASSNSMANLLSRGRKRGQCAVLATQRLSKINKNVAAECLNVMIGKSTLTNDIKRGLDTLGWPAKDGSVISGLETGQFICYGPAFGGGEPEIVKVGPVTTHHPKVA
jgi:DNA helicase HerA-like ATPase